MDSAQLVKPTPTAARSTPSPTATDFGSCAAGVIRRVLPHALKRRAVHRAFVSGAKAVCLHGEDRVQQLWNAFVPDVDDESAFWNADVFTTAENHLAGDTHFGDMLRFGPGQFGHFARKIATYPDERSNEMRVFPAGINHGHDAPHVHQIALRTAWDLVLEIQKSALPVELEPSACAVTIQLLKYPNSVRVLQDMFGLMEDSGGRWTRVGYKVDAARASACGLFDRRGIRDVFGCASLIPGVGRWLQEMNGKFKKRANDGLTSQEVIVGPAHRDSHRYLSMLAGERDVIKTEVCDGGCWTEIPLSSSTLTILPGTACPPRWGIRPTMHRYSIGPGNGSSSKRSLNLTLLLGTIPRVLIPESLPTPSNLSRSKVRVSGKRRSGKLPPSVDTRG